MFHRDLTNNGYRKYSVPSTADNCIVATYAKKIEDEKGIMYFIHIEVWGMNSLKAKCDISRVAKVQFKTVNNEIFNVEYYIEGNTDVKKVEGFYMKLWESMDCQYYELKY